MKIHLDCNFKCYDCSRKGCDMLTLFKLPDNMFYNFVLEALKLNAGLRITQGIPKHIVDEDLKKKAVAIKISRDIYHNKLPKN